MIDLHQEESKYLEIISLSSGGDELEIISISDSSEYHHPNKNDLSENFLDNFEYISDSEMNDSAFVNPADDADEEKLSQADLEACLSSTSSARII